MHGVLRLALSTLKAAFRPRAALVLENLALRQQLANLRRRQPERRAAGAGDRAFWILLSRLWSDWRSALAVWKPDTVVRWHQAGFRAFWRWRSRPGPGRPLQISPEIRALVAQMAAANPTWGAPRIHGELKKIGVVLSERTVSRLLAGRPAPRSDGQRWDTFLRNHLADLACIDFFVMPTVSFRLLYVFLVLSADRRRVLHFNLTEHPTAAWTARQIVEAFPDDATVRYLLRDNDAIYGGEVRRRVAGLGLKEIRTAKRSPWQNPYVERLIGSIRRECLDHVIVLDEDHLRRILRAYFDYYHGSRTHLGLGKECPDPRPVQGLDAGHRIVAIPKVGGLHHRYERRAG